MVTVARTGMRLYAPAEPPARRRWRVRGAGRSKAAAEGACRLCLRPKDVRPLTRHHLVPLWWFGHEQARGRTRFYHVRNCDANIVPLCRVCHDEVEQTDAGRRMLRRRLLADEAEFVAEVRGGDWLERTYPLGFVRGGR